MYVKVGGFVQSLNLLKQNYLMAVREKNYVGGAQYMLPSNTILNTGYRKEIIYAGNR